MVDTVIRSRIDFADFISRFFSLLTWHFSALSLLICSSHYLVSCLMVNTSASAVSFFSLVLSWSMCQGFDTDDGSSWYDIKNNFFFEADAWKMDYGGHDSRFVGNVVYHGHNDGQNCVNTWPFLPGHGAMYDVAHDFDANGVNVELWASKIVCMWVWMLVG